MAANRIADRTMMLSATTGVGALTLTPNPGTAWRTFEQGFIRDGDRVTVEAISADGQQWEIFEGIYSASGPSVSRVTLQSNSLNSGSFMAWAAGTKRVYSVTPAARHPIFGPDNNLPIGAPVGNTDAARVDWANAQDQSILAQANGYTDAAIVAKHGKLVADFAGSVGIGNSSPTDFAGVALYTNTRFAKGEYGVDAENTGSKVIVNYTVELRNANGGVIASGTTTYSRVAQSGINITIPFVFGPDDIPNPNSGLVVALKVQKQTADGAVAMFNVACRGFAIVV